MARHQLMHFPGWGDIRMVEGTPLGPQVWCDRWTVRARYGDRRHPARPARQRVGCGMRLRHCSSCKTRRKLSAFAIISGKRQKTCTICLDKKANSLPRIAKRAAANARKDAWGLRWRATFGSATVPPAYESCDPEPSLGRPPVPQTLVLRSGSLSDMERGANGNGLMGSGTRKSGGHHS